jgi:hypothetical protein
VLAEALASGLLSLFPSGLFVPPKSIPLIGLFLLSAGMARPAVTLLLEEPFGIFGGMTPTGHAAVYLSHICAASPISLRRCNEGEQGVVISRYNRISGYDWLAIPLLPYLYAVDRPDEVPSSVASGDVAAYRNAWRRANLAEVVPDSKDGSQPDGDWIQLIGSAYDRTIYAFGIETTEQQDERFIETFNSRANHRHFNILFHNCADFVRKAIDFYYPYAIHRSFIADVGIMTPKQAAGSLASYSKRHRDLQFSVFVIPQVDGTVPRSRPARGVLESLVNPKRYAVPLVSVAALHRRFGRSLAFAWIEGSHFNLRRLAKPGDSMQPAVLASELESNRVVTASESE